MSGTKKTGLWARFLGRTLGKLVYFSMYAVGALLFVIPFPIKKAVARIVARVWFDGIQFRRRIILHNLALVFPRERQETMDAFRRRCEKLGRANVVHSVLCFFEIFERFLWNEDVIRKKVTIHGLAHAKPYLERRQGFFVSSAHLGNWELITLVGVSLGTRLAVVTKFLRNPFFDSLWVESRRRYGLDLLQERGSGLAIVKAIRQGRVVGFIMDQHTGEPHGILTEFLGLPAWSPKALAILAPRLKAPVFPAYLIRRPDGNFDLTIEDDLYAGFRVESGTSEEESLRYHVKLCNENMAQWIRKYPEQYLWLHRRFKNQIDYRSPLVWEL